MPDDVTARSDLEVGDLVCMPIRVEGPMFDWDPQDVGVVHQVYENRGCFVLFDSKVWRGSQDEVKKSTICCFFI